MAELRSKTLKLVKSAINKIYDNYNYFSTLSGSKTLVMLASFEEGREIIKLLLPQKVPIGIFSFHIPLTEINDERLPEFSIAIEYWKSHYSKLKDKFGCNSENDTSTENNNESNDSLKDKIIYRSSEEGSVSSEKCEIMATNENVLTVLIKESSYDLFKLLFNRILFDSKKLGPGCLSALTDALVFLQEEGNSVVIIKYLVWEYITKGSEEKTKELSNLCVIPLPHFNSYNDFPEDRLKNSANGDDIIPYKTESAFTRIASSQNDNNIFRQGDTILEVLLEYKWKMFARKKFAFICFIHALYYVSYSTGVLFSRTLYVKGENNEFDMEHPGHIASLVVMGFSLAILVYKETQQFFNGRSKMAYINSGYNWVDIAAFGFPVLTVLQSLLGWNYFVRKSFTQAFVVLLRMEEDAYFQDNFSGNFTSNTTLTTGIVNTEGLTDSANVSADNGFVNWFKAFSQVWFFIYGVWDPVLEGEAGDSKMLMAMCILFSFIIVLIFFNMVM
ncbi:hypothetical protein HPULCUR_009396 [Helicostylum pulchrum]|uniref:Ion transport domain-containing protein n=1 Tax=Helicostylum pulchrum TaxID=562976 RepID=A0ABP9YAC6_9FUNG